MNTVLNILGLTSQGGSSASDDNAVTYNGNPSFETIGKPHLDYYGGVTRQTEDKDIKQLASACVENDLELALATFFQKRDCRGGSGERKPFIISLELVPKTLRQKLYSLIPEYGYWDDLNGFARKITEDREFIANLFAKQLFNNIRKFTSDIVEIGSHDRNLEKWLPTENQQDDKEWKAVNKIIAAFNKLLEGPIQLRYIVASKVVEDFKKRAEKLDAGISKNIKYVVGQKLEYSSENEKVKVLAEKYQHVFDKIKNLPIVLSELKKTGYRRWCSFARAYYGIIEHYKSTGDWGLINYSSVPSIAFDRSKKQFQKHDSERFQEFIESVKKGETNINVGSLMPYQLLAQESTEVRDEQWKLMVKEVSEFYKSVSKDNIFHPEQSIHVADVSGSMDNSSNPKPLHISLSLALLMSEISGKSMYTFTEQPRKYEPTWKSLTEAQQMVQDPKYNTNFRGLIDRIFDDCMIEADKKDVAPSEVIPGSIYVYTDGGFDQMCKEQPTTAVDYIVNKFGKFKKVPVIIFWNVAGNVKDFAVNTSYNGIVQLAGFSKDVYQNFTRLTSLDEIAPESFFRKAVLCERYLPVLDLYQKWKSDN